MSEIRSRRAGIGIDESRLRPLYARVLGLQYLRPSSLMCFLFFEGTVALAVLLALAELVNWWAVLVLPASVAAMVKANDIISGASVPSGGRTLSSAPTVSEALVPPGRRSGQDNPAGAPTGSRGSARSGAGPAAVPATRPASPDEAHAVGRASVPLRVIPDSFPMPQESSLAPASAPDSAPDQGPAYKPLAPDALTPNGASTKGWPPSVAPAAGSTPEASVPERSLHEERLHEVTVPGASPPAPISPGTGELWVTSPEQRARQSGAFRYE